MVFTGWQLGYTGTGVKCVNGSRFMAGPNVWFSDFNVAIDVTDNGIVTDRINDVNTFS